MNLAKINKFHIKYEIVEFFEKVIFYDVTHCNWVQYCPQQLYIVKWERLKCSFIHTFFFYKKSGPGFLEEVHITVNGARHLIINKNWAVTKTSLTLFKTASNTLIRSLSQSELKKKFRFLVHFIHRDWNRLFFKKFAL